MLWWHDDVKQVLKRDNTSAIIFEDEGFEVVSRLRPPGNRPCCVLNNTQLAMSPLTVKFELLWQELGRGSGGQFHGSPLHCVA